jgi:hypothetical protein
VSVRTLFVGAIRNGAFSLPLRQWAQSDSNRRPPACRAERADERGLGQAQRPQKRSAFSPLVADFWKRAETGLLPGATRNDPEFHLGVRATFSLRNWKGEEAEVIRIPDEEFADPDFTVKAEDFPEPEEDA